MTDQVPKSDSALSNLRLPKNVMWIFLGVITIHIILLIILWLVPIDLQIKSDFGQATEIISTLFGGLAFAGAIVALLLQNVELALQRKELEQTNAELQITQRNQEIQKQIVLKTAQINAYTALVDHYQELAQNTSDEGSRIEFEKTRDQNVRRLESMIQEVEG